MIAAHKSQKQNFSPQKKIVYEKFEPLYCCNFIKKPSNVRFISFPLNFKKKLILGALLTPKSQLKIFQKKPIAVIFKPLYYCNFMQNTR